ncbi:zinc-binding dehydrogenase [Kaistia hirudinis]|uniref:zinc-binding dehydrogenase n=1 Tax=Kaistia hirudinis TaxID=1293440 RepID=UPI0035E5F836
MRSVVFERFGAPSEVLGTAERPIPQPGPGEIRVRLVLSPIHNHDLWTIRGTYGVKPALPATGGTEALGIVDALGEGVSGPAIGRRVVITGVSGVWSEFFLAPAARAIPIPDSIDDETACQLIAMPVSALILLHDLEVKAGDWIAQNAANGAVGRLVARLAAKRGVRVLSVVRRDAGLAELSAAGIGDAGSSEHVGWQERVQAITGGAPILRGVDSVGGEAANQLAELLASGGRLVSFGAMSNRPLEISSGLLIFRRITVSGFWAAVRTGELGPKLGEMIGELITMAASGELRLPVDGVFPLEKAAEAAAASDRPGRGGKVVLKP